MIRNFKSPAIYSIAVSLFYLFFSFESVAQGPTIASVLPVSASAGSTVTINGTNFSPTAANNIVYFGAVKATVTTAIATRLTVVVPYGATYAPVTVTVNGLKAYSRLPFIVKYQNAEAVDENLFDDDVRYTTGVDPIAVKMGDLDSDGQVDLVVSNSPSNTVSVFRNITSPGIFTSSSFAPKIDFATGANPLYLALEDVDGDGKLDIVVPNSGSGTVSVLRNLSAGIGSISFAAKVDFTVGAGPQEVAVADIDSDGKPEIITVNSASNTISILKNNSTPGAVNSGSFAAKVDYVVKNTPTGVHVSDLNGDGKADIAVANLNGFEVSVFQNNSAKGVINASSLSARLDYPTGANPWRVAIGDLDMDNKPEIVAITYGNNMRVFKNSTTGSTLTTSSFSQFTDFKTSANPIQCIVAEITGDGRPDIAVSTKDANTISIFRNVSEGSAILFADPFEFQTGPGPNAVAIGDLNLDGKPELVSANNASGENTISVLRNIGLAPIIQSVLPEKAKTGESILLKGKFYTQNEQEITLRVGGKKTTVTSVNENELRFDLPSGISSEPISVNLNGLSASSNSFVNTLFESTGIYGNTFSDPTSYTTGQNPKDLAVGDFNDDGKMDLVTVNGASNTLTVWKNSNTSNGGAVSFSDRVDLAAPAAPNSVESCDFDGDGKLDLVSVGGTYLSIYRNVSTGSNISFSRVDFVQSLAPEPFSIRDVAIGDMDSDGKIDICLLSASEVSDNYNYVYIYTNRAQPGIVDSGSLIFGTFFYTERAALNMAIGDLDNDGLRDIVIINNQSHTISVRRNISKPSALYYDSFEAKIDYAADFAPFDLVLEDLNDDNKPEIIIANNFGHKISILENKTTSGSFTTTSFSIRTNLSTGADTFPTHVAVADFDGDGKKDIAASCNGLGGFANNKIVVFRSKVGLGKINTNFFYPAIDFNSGLYPAANKAADFNNDGKPDLAFVNSSSANVSVLTNNTDDILRITTQPLAGYLPADFTQQTVTVNVTGGTGIRTVNLRYRKITESTFSSVLCTDLGNNNFNATILPEMTDELGVEFYFEATDITGITRESIGHSYLYKSVNGEKNPEFINTKSMNGSASTYQMFSIPYELDQKDAETNFSEFGPYDKGKWRLFTYLLGAYKENKEGFSDLEIGSAYWLNGKDLPTPVKVGNGKVAEANQAKPFLLQLNRGWNQIGNPFPFDVDWDFLRNLSENEDIGINSLWQYSSGSYSKTGTLKTWSGGFVFSDNQGTLTIPVTARKKSGARKSSDVVTQNIDNEEWLLPLNLELNGLTSESGIGMHPAAMPSKDKHDEIAMPRFTSYLEMTTSHPEFFAPNFSVDRMHSADTHEWIFTLSSSEDQGVAKLSWTNEHLSEAKSRLVLIDMTDFSMIDMNKSNHYEFNWKEGRQIKIIYSKSGEILPGVSALGDVFPNPFKESVTFTVFVADDNTDVELKIVDSSGRKVSSLELPNLQAGIHLVNEQQFTGEGNLPPGLYLLQFYAESSNKVISKRIIKL